MLKRLFDLIVLFFFVSVALFPIILISLLVLVTSGRPILYWSDRVGRCDVLFRMPKFRTMRVGTPVVATHLLVRPESHLTPIGAFLRKTSLDEIPQLWCIFLGDMSFVGPRPALFNQHELINLRRLNGTSRLVPGLTGWAQINGRDDITLIKKADLDAEYLRRRGLLFDLRIILLTVVKVMQRKGVSH